MIDKEELQRRARMTRIPYALSRGQRGLRISTVMIAMDAAAIRASLMFNGQLRKARIMLASHIYEREISSYNELTDAELDVLSVWSESPQAIEQIADWMQKTFGKQLSLIEGQDG